MKQIMKGAVALIALSMLAAGASAQKPKTAAKTMICPSCKMVMTMKKSKGAPVAIKTKKGTFYCCAGCATGKAAMKKK
jgi:hypothetical protein